MTPPTPCQRCKAERDELRDELQTIEAARVAAWDLVRVEQARVRELEERMATALGELEDSELADEYDSVERAMEALRGQ